MPSSGSQAWPVQPSRPWFAALGMPPFVIGVDRDGIAVDVGDPNYRALLVGAQELAGKAPGHLVPDERLVRARAVNVGTQQSVGAVIFYRQAVAVVEEPGGAARPC